MIEDFEPDVPHPVNRRLCLRVRPPMGEMFPPICNQVLRHQGNHRAKQWYGQYSAEWENDGADND